MLPNNNLFKQPKVESKPSHVPQQAQQSKPQVVETIA